MREAELFAIRMECGSTLCLRTLADALVTEMSKTSLQYQLQCSNRTIWR